MDQSIVKVAILNDKSVHTNQDIIWMDKKISAGIKTPIYIVISDIIYNVVVEEESPLWLLGKDLGEIKCIKNAKDGSYGSIMSQAHRGDNLPYTLIQFVMNADVEGEYIVDVRFEGQFVHDMCFGFIVEGDNEILKIETMNKGVELPDQIDRALYSKSPYSHGIDYTLMNAKRRELLLNYMDLIGNQGSYKSLLNSLEWFGYGPLVEPREIWEWSTPDGIKYLDKELSKELTEEMAARTATFAKSASIILRNITSRDQNGVICEDYTWHENDMPVDVCTYEWSKEVMRTKMALLSNFFQAHFMPIHMSLLQSCVQDICENMDALTGGTLLSSGMIRSDKYFEDMDVAIYQDGEEIPLIDDEYDVLIVEHSECYTKYGSYFIPFNGLGVAEYEDIQSLSSVRDNVEYAGGLGAIFEVRMDLQGAVIENIRLTSDIPGFKRMNQNWQSSTRNIFKLMIREEGSYNINLFAELGDGRQCVKHIRISVTDASAMNISFSKYVLQSGWVKENNPFTALSEDVEKDFINNVIVCNDDTMHKNHAYLTIIKNDYKTGPQGNSKVFPLISFSIDARSESASTINSLKKSIRDKLDSNISPSNLLNIPRYGDKINGWYFVREDKSSGKTKIFIRITGLQRNITNYETFVRQRFATAYGTIDYNKIQVDHVFIPAWHRKTYIGTDEHVNVDEFIVTCETEVRGINRSIEASRDINPPFWEVRDPLSDELLTSTPQGEGIKVPYIPVQQINHLGALKLTFNWQWGKTQKSTYAISPKFHK